LRRKHGPDAFTSAHPEVQERFEAKFLQDRRVGLFAAPLAGDEMARDAGFEPYGAHRRHGGGETVEHHGGPLSRRTQDHAGEDGKFRATERSQGVERPMKASRTGTGSGQSCFDHPTFPGESLTVASSTEADSFGGAETEECCAQCGGNRRVAHTDFSESDQPPFHTAS
jgi:hypothetical protein